MSRKKKDTMEFRFYEIPQGEAALVLCGDNWVRVYGHDEFHLHFHNLLEIGVCRYGQGLMHFDQDKIRYEQGSITIIPENYPHVTISDGEERNFWEYIFIDLRSVVEEIFPENCVLQNNVLNAIGKRAILTSSREDTHIAGIIDAIVDETVNRRPLHQEMEKLHVKALVMELIRREDIVSSESENLVKGTNMEQIAAGLDYINKNYNRPIKVKDLAEICGMSQTHFRRLFEEYINMTPMDYVNLIRVQRACDMMKKSNASMEIVAEKCGFIAMSTFNRNFKKFLNTSPYQWKINPDNYEGKLLNFRISALKGW